MLNNNFSGMDAETACDSCRVVAFEVSAAMLCREDFRIVTEGRVCFQDTSPPAVIKAPSSFTVECGDHADLITAWMNNHGYSSAYDDCSQNVTVAASYSNTSLCGHSHVVNAHFEFQDKCNNSIYATANISVHDTTAPSMLVVPDAYDLYEAGFAWEDPGVDVQDRCDELRNLFLEVLDKPDVLKSGSYVVTYRSRDRCNNVQTVTRLFNATDTLPPRVDPKSLVSLWRRPLWIHRTDLIPSFIEDTAVVDLVDSTPHAIYSYFPSAVIDENTSTIQATIHLADKFRNAYSAPLVTVLVPPESEQGHIVLGVRAYRCDSSCGFGVFPKAHRDFDVQCMFLVFNHSNDVGAFVETMQFEKYSLNSYVWMNFSFVMVSTSLISAPIVNNLLLHDGLLFASKGMNIAHHSMVAFSCEPWFLERLGVATSLIEYPTECHEIGCICTSHRPQPHMTPRMYPVIQTKFVVVAIENISSEEEMFMHAKRLWGDSIVRVVHQTNVSWDVISLGRPEARRQLNTTIPFSVESSVQFSAAIITIKVDTINRSTSDKVVLARHWLLNHSVYPEQLEVDATTDTIRASTFSILHQGLLKRLREARTTGFGNLTVTTVHSSLHLEPTEIDSNMTLEISEALDNLLSLVLPLQSATQRLVSLQPESESESLDFENGTSHFSLEANQSALNLSCYDAYLLKLADEFLLSNLTLMLDGLIAYGEHMIFLEMENNSGLFLNSTPSTCNESFSAHDCVLKQGLFAYAFYK